MLRLFIENAELELGEDFSCPITRSFEDIENPTNIKNDFSKTITIPHTQSNDRLFGHIYNPDRLTVANQKNEALKGIYFDPYKKIDFRLEWNDSVVMTGYLKVLSVTDKGYECTLNGELGKIFQEMQKITMDASIYTTPTDINKYYLNTQDYYYEYMNKDLVWDSWTSTGGNLYPLVKRSDSRYKASAIVGWSPLNYRTDSDVMDQKTFQLSGQPEAVKFSDVLKQPTNPSFAEQTLCSPETAVENGMMPREIGEFRSYLQQPFIYFSKLFRIYLEKVESTTGYTFNLDESWFNNGNNYWTDVVMTLKNFDKNDESYKSNYYNVNWEAWRYADGSLGGPWLTPTVVEHREGTTESVWKSQAKLWDIHYYPNVGITYETTLKFYNYITSGGYRANSGAEIKKDNAFILMVAVTPTAGMESTNAVFAVIDADCTIKDDILKRFPSATFVNTTNTINDDPYILFDANIKGYLYGTSDMVGIKLETNGFWWKQDEAPIHIVNAQVISNLYNIEVRQKDKSTFGFSCYDKYRRTGAKMTINSLWNNSYNIFDIVLNYTKMFRLGWFVDEAGKTVTIKPFNEYFKSYKIKDYTNKIDRSSEYIVKPVTFENKYVVFNYKDNDTDINNTYKTATKFQFGEANIVTQYVFNDSSTKLFSDIPCPIENTDNILSWTNLYDNLKIEYSFPKEKFVYSKDKDNKLVDNFGTLYFDNGITQFDKDPFLALRQPKISDDTILQRGSGKFYYTQDSYDKFYIRDVDSFHQLSISDDNNLITFNTPSFTYTYEDYEGKPGLYYLFWKNYIEERYNTQNKIVQCYLTLTPSDFVNFQFNNFIVIDNQLYMVNKIYDYAISSDKPTKVDLITIQNISGYTENNF